jgi:hypothetical protein
MVVDLPILLTYRLRGDSYIHPPRSLASGQESNSKLSLTVLTRHFKDPRTEFLTRQNHDQQAPWKISQEEKHVDNGILVGEIGPLNDIGGLGLHPD